MKKNANDSLRRGQKQFEPRIVAFVCNWCSGAGGSLRGGTPGARKRDLPNVRIVNVMCSGRVTPGLVLKAFELGADGVIVCGCERGSCHYSFGNERQTEMYETSRKLAGLIGLEPERLRLDLLPSDGGQGLHKAIGEFLKQVTQAGPSPLRKSGGKG